jgi:hypothetical protein
VEAAVSKILPLLETSGEAVFKSRSCVSCHNNSLDFESGFPHSWHQFASAGASSWATMALLFTLPDR